MLDRPRPAGNQIDRFVAVQPEPNQPIGATDCVDEMAVLQNDHLGRHGTRINGGRPRFAFEHDAANDDVPFFILFDLAQ